MITATLNFIDAGPVVVDIQDGRRAALPGWEECGFELVERASATPTWEDEDVVRVHHAEAAAWARELTGADAAVVWSHIKRNPDAARQHKDLAPISFVHCDFADSYGDQLRAMLAEPGAGSELAIALRREGIDGRRAAGAARLVVLQFWRNIGPARMDMPLAFCDARTVRRTEVRPIAVTNYAGGGFDFEALAITSPRAHSPQRWYAFLEMAPHEAVAFRTFDTDRIATGEPYWTPHSAFRDPDVALGKPARSSIELRATCLFY